MKLELAKMKEYTPILVMIIAVLAITWCVIIFSFLEPGGRNGPEGCSPNQGSPAHMDFSSPSSEVASDKSATFIISCLDLQRFLNKDNSKLQLKEDGICGPATQRAWDNYVNTQYALSLWTEDAR